MPRPLKVFRAHLGFYDTVVAATSKKAALQAWGARGGEFSHGFADVTNDAEAVKAALAQPGVVLRRLFGSHEPFKEEADFSKLPKAKKLPVDKAGRARAAKAARTQKAEAAAAAKAERKRASKEERRQKAKAAAAAKAAREAERRRAKAAADAELAEIEKEERRLRERRQALKQKLRGG